MIPRRNSRTRGCTVDFCSCFRLAGAGTLAPGWRAIIGRQSGPDGPEESDYCVAYFQAFYQGEPGLLFRRSGRGGFYVARTAAQKERLRDHLESGPDKWFLPFLDRLGRGERISI